MANHHSNHHAAPHHGGHEKSDAEIGPLWKFGVFLTVFTLIAAFIVVQLFNVLEQYRVMSDNSPSALSSQRNPPPGHLLQASPRGDMKAMRDSEEQALHSYKLISKGANQVQIPITRAIGLIAERGLPVRSSEAKP